MGKVVAIVLATSLSPFSFVDSLNGITDSDLVSSIRKERLGHLTQGFASHIFSGRHSNDVNLNNMQPNSTVDTRKGVAKDSSALAL